MAAAPVNETSYQTSSHIISVRLFDGRTKWRWSRWSRQSNRTSRADSNSAQRPGRKAGIQMGTQLWQVRSTNGELRDSYKTIPCCTWDWKIQPIDLAT